MWERLKPFLGIGVFFGLIALMRFGARKVSSEYGPEPSVGSTRDEIVSNYTMFYNGREITLPTTTCVPADGDDPYNITIPDGWQLDFVWISSSCLCDDSGLADFRYFQLADDDELAESLEEWYKERSDQPPFTDDVICTHQVNETAIATDGGSRHLTDD